MHPFPLSSVGVLLDFGDELLGGLVADHLLGEVQLQVTQNFSVLRLAWQLPSTGLRDLLYFLDLRQQVDTGSLDGHRLRQPH